MESTVGGDCILFNGGMGVGVWCLSFMETEAFGAIDERNEWGSGAPFFCVLLCFASLLCLFTKGVTHVGLPTLHTTI